MKGNTNAQSEGCYQITVTNSSSVDALYQVHAIKVGRIITISLFYNLSSSATGVTLFTISSNETNVRLAPYTLVGANGFNVGGPDGRNIWLNYANNGKDMLLVVPNDTSLGTGFHTTSFSYPTES